MKKAITFILVLAILAGGFYFCMQAGFIDKWFPGVLEKVIPGYTPPNSAEGGRVSSKAENAVYVDPVSMIAELGSGTGQVERFRYRASADQGIQAGERPQREEVLRRRGRSGERGR